MNGDVMQTPLPSGMIDLGLGDPDPRLLPLARLQLAASALFAESDVSPLQYGNERGDPPACTRWPSCLASRTE